MNRLTFPLVLDHIRKLKSIGINTNAVHTSYKTSYPDFVGCYLCSLSKVKVLISIQKLIFFYVNELHNLSLLY